MLVTGDHTEERQELERVLESGILDRSPSLAQVLTYVCEKYFEGNAQEIKEYNIAIDALGRSADFDQKKDSIVRVQVHRLRERLTEYYAHQGAGHGIHIVIPQGQYVPNFVVKESEEPSPAQALLAQAEEVAYVSALAPATSLWKQKWAWGGAAVIAAGVIAVTLMGARASSVVTAVPPAVTAAASPVVRIGVGMDKPFTDGYGHVWEADRNFTSGNVLKASNHPIRGTRDPQLYQVRREGTFRYDIPLDPGTYELRLYFAEVYFGETNLAGVGGESSRAFGIDINNKPAVKRLDVIGEAGASTAHIKVFKDVEPDSDGKLHLQFTPIAGMPFLNGIEIAPSSPHRLNPIRIVAKERCYTDSQGHLWVPDRFVIGGQLVKRGPIAAAPEPDLYAGERFGNLQYEIPVPPGRYTLKLYMAERWHGPNLPGGGEFSSRLFDLHLNGLLLAKELDIFKLAGGAERPLVKTYSGLEPNHQGYLALSMVPVKGFATINALEVLDEAR